MAGDVPNGERTAVVDGERAGGGTRDEGEDYGTRDELHCCEARVDR